MTPRRRLRLLLDRSDTRAPLSEPWASEATRAAYERWVENAKCAMRQYDGLNPHIRKMVGFVGDVRVARYLAQCHVETEREADDKVLEILADPVLLQKALRA